MVFEPKERTNINYELVAQGLARLDIDDDAALDKFPEFIDAAEQALVAGRGFAADWRADAAYVDAVRAARNKRTRYTTSP